MSKVYRFKITGVSGVLMNNPASMRRPGTNPGPPRIPPPEEEAKAKVYQLDGEGSQLYIPAVAFRSSMIGKGGGAANRKIGKFTVNTLVGAGVFLVDTKCPIVHLKTGKPISDYEIDTRRAVVQQQGIMRSRPYVTDWSCCLDLEIDEDFITAEQVLEVLNISGKVAGVLDFRPQKKGWFGRYKAELVSDKTPKAK